TINSTLKDRTNKTTSHTLTKQPHTNERKLLCLNQYSVLQLHTARLSELSSSSRRKVSQPRKSQCSCLIRAARETLVTLKRQRRQRAQRPVQPPGAPPAAGLDCWQESARWQFPASVRLLRRVQLWRRLAAWPWERR